MLRRDATIEVVSPAGLLDSLRRKDPALRTGPYDADALARLILHLPPGTAVDGTARKALYDLVTEAHRAGRATSLATLGAYHAARQGLFRSRHRFVAPRPDGKGQRAAGLDWLGMADKNLNLARLQVKTVRQDGTERTRERSTPWPEDDVYLVAADGAHDKVTVPWPDGMTRDLGIDEFVELMALDPELARLPEDTAIVLVVPHGGDRDVELLRKLADRTGRLVLGHSREVTLVAGPGGRPLVHVTHTRGKPEGDWVPGEPEMVADADENVPSWYHKVVSTPVINADTREQSGRASLDSEVLARLESRFRRAHAITKFAHFNPVTKTYSAKFPARRRIAPGAKVKTFALHGGPGFVSFYLNDGTYHDARGVEGARWLKRRKSFSGLGRNDWLFLPTCWAGTTTDRGLLSEAGYGDARPDPFVPNPLTDPLWGSSTRTSSTSR